MTLNKLFTIIKSYQKSVLCKGLQFPLPPKTLKYPDEMVSFELLFRDIKTTKLNKHSSNEIIKPRWLDTLFSIISDRSKFEKRDNQEKKCLNLILNS